MRLKARDEDNPRCTAEIELDGTSELNCALGYGDEDAILDALEEAYDKTEDTAKSAELREFIDTVEKMSLPRVEIEED